MKSTRRCCDTTTASLAAAPRLSTIKARASLMPDRLLIASRLALPHSPSALLAAGVPGFPVFALQENENPRTALN